MEMLYLIALAVIFLAISAYAQYRVKYHTRNQARTLLTRAVLLVVGFSFGLVSAVVYLDVNGSKAVLVTLIGLGLVHTPAAIILFLKRQRARDMDSSK